MRHANNKIQSTSFITGNSNLCLGLTLALVRSLAGWMVATYALMHACVSLSANVIVFVITQNSWSRYNCGMKSLLMLAIKTARKIAAFYRFSSSSSSCMNGFVSLCISSHRFLISLICHLNRLVGVDASTQIHSHEFIDAIHNLILLIDKYKCNSNEI